MITRIYTDCPGCGTPTAVRVGLGHARRQRVLLHCPTCGSTIRGLVTLNDDDFDVEMDTPTTAEPEDWQSVQSITTHPDFPTDPSAPMLSPFIAATMAFGSAFPKFMEALGMFHSFADNEWPTVERAYGFYLKGNWLLFDRAMRQLLGDDNWPDDPSMLQRHDVIHRILASVCCR